MGMKGVSGDLARRCLELAGQTGKLGEDIDEKTFQAAVIRRAKELGWRAYHVHFSQRSDPGYPDLTCWRERVLWMELKKFDGKVTEEQKRVMEQLREAGAEVYLFRPSDWQKIEEVLNIFRPCNV